MYNSRRSFLKNIGSIISLASLPLSSVTAANHHRIIIVGGGVAGTRASAYLKMLVPSASVMLFDPVLKNVKDNNYFSIKNNYRPVSKYVLDEIGVDIYTDTVMQVDPAEKSISLANGKRYKADFLVLAPGVDFKWDDLNGYTAGIEQNILHAWKHPGNMSALWQEVKSMEDGASVVVSVPQAPYRFPQGPYQRTTEIAAYLKSFKPRSKIVVLDSNNVFPAMDRYLEKWKTQHPHRVEWVSANNGGSEGVINIKENTIHIGGEVIKPGVLNYIPPQKSGAIAAAAGLNVESDWCQVSPQTLESIHYSNVYVIGDANNADMNYKTAATAEKHALKCVTGIKQRLS